VPKPEESPLERAIRTCGEKLTVSSIKLLDPKGGKSTLYFDNPRREPFIKITVDGCVVKKSAPGSRCDYLVLDPVGKEHYVELKGQKVLEAEDQLESSIRRLSANPTGGAKRCFIITSRVPQLTSDIQRMKRRFKRDYSAILTVANSPYRYSPDRAG